jgi:hypothetical protein
VTELNYEPRVILEHANRLNRRADSMGLTSAIIGAVIGGFFGAVPLTSLGDRWPIPHQFGFGTLLAGILVGALAGYVIGDARSFGYRLQAQSSLCQLHLERNTAALLSDAYTAVPAARPEAPAAPVFEYSEPEPEPEPAPVEEMHVPEYFAPEPEAEPESPSFVNARIAAHLDPAPEPEPVAVATLVPEYVEPAPEPVLEPVLEPAFEPVLEPAFEPAPEPAPFAEAPTLVPARLADPLPTNLDSLSLEEIAQLAKTGQI